MNLLYLETNCNKIFKAELLSSDTWKQQYKFNYDEEMQDETIINDW